MSEDELNLRRNLMKEIKDEVLNLKISPLYTYRTKNNFLPVIGEGSHLAKIMLVGEAPGRNEAKTGRPFCGAAGKILDELLAHAEIAREEIYITNIVKDRPPENRDPTEEEIKIYGPFLDRQIEIIKPKIIGSLGRYAMGYLMDKLSLSDQKNTIGKLHGKSFLGKTSRAQNALVHFVALYHPAVAIYNQASKDDLKKDFLVLKEVLKKI